MSEHSADPACISEGTDSVDGLLHGISAVCPTPTIPCDEEEGSKAVGAETMEPCTAEAAQDLPQGAHAADNGDSADTPANKPDELKERGRQQVLAKHFSNCSTRRPSPTRGFARRGRSALGVDSIHDAAKFGDTVNLALHMQTASKIEAFDDDGMQPLHYAAAYGYPDATELLLQGNAPVNICDKDGSTPLFLACRYARKACIEKLLAAGARKEGSVETRYVSALHNAAYNGDVECIELLLQAKAQVQEKDKDEWTPLHYATRFNRVSAIEHLIQARADVNAMDIIGWTPCHNACRNGLMHALEILLRSNPDLSICNKYNETVLHIACRKGKAKVVIALLEHAQNQRILSTLMSMKDVTGADVFACSRDEYIRTILRNNDTGGLSNYDIFTVSAAARTAKIQEERDEDRKRKARTCSIL